MRKKQSKEKNFKLIDGDKFNSDYPRGYNLELGYCCPNTNPETRSYKPFITIIE